MPLVICENCDKKFTKRLVDIKKTKHNFCSRSCAASVNNRKYPKRHNEGFCATCGAPVPKRRSYCDNCVPNKIDWSKVSYSELRARYKYQRNSRIRGLARSVYLRSGRPKSCMVCGYNKCFNVCHKRPVSTFSPDDKIPTINDIDNLIALCPNHHWELDNGILILP